MVVLGELTSQPRFRAQGKEIAMKRTLLEYFKSTSSPLYRELTLRRPDLDHHLGSVQKTRCWADSAGHFDTKSLQFCIDTIGVERVMFSIDCASLRVMTDLR